MSAKPRIDIPQEALADFCRRWKIIELSLFGSVMRDDFGPDSDVDVLLTFAPDAEWHYFHLLDMKDELEVLLRRSVDVVEKGVIESSENYIRRKHILSSAETVYVA